MNTRTQLTQLVRSTTSRAARAWTAATAVALFAGTAAIGTSQCLAQGIMYACENGRQFYSINLATGAKTFLGNITGMSSFVSGSLAYDCTTAAEPKSYVSATSGTVGQSRNIYRLNTTTRVASLLGPYGDTAIIMHAIEINHHTGALYGVSIHNHGLYSIDRTTGAATLIGLTGIPIGVTTFDSLSFNPDDGVMYLINTGTDSLYTVNLSTGVATLVGPLLGPIGCGGMAYNIDNHIMYFVDNDLDILNTVDLTTGAATPIGSTGVGNLIGLVYVTPTCPPPLPPDVPGDIDGDGDVDGVDQNLFVAVLLGDDTDPAHQARSNLNGDAAADGLDVGPFVAALLGP